jgi:prepilin-type N-terminal cleavage/methylation domain-containing protein
VDGRKAAFTLLELLIVVMVMAIIAASAVPALVSSQDSQCNGAARAVIADLELAQSTAMAQQTSVAVVFSAAQQAYKVVLPQGQNLANYASLTALNHPEKPGQPYEVKLARDLNAPNVTFANPAFGGQPYIVFDTFGGTTTSGSVRIVARDASRTVSVDAITGAVSVQ